MFCQGNKIRLQVVEIPSQVPFVAPAKAGAPNLPLVDDDTKMDSGMRRNDAANASGRFWYKYS
jgi:hypothetical protein